MLRSDDRYPIITLEKYEVESQLIGIQQTGQNMATKYGATLRVEFVPAGETSGAGNWPTRDIYFKVLPKGLSDFKGLLLGYPVLDAPPQGLGH